MQAIVMDGLDRDSVIKAETSSRPDVIVHQTALAPVLDLKRFDDELESTNRLRTEGTSHLVAAAVVTGTRTFVAQSYTGWPNQRHGGRIKTEVDPLDTEKEHHDERRS